MNNLRDSSNEHFLSEWIEGRMTDAELKAKVSASDYNAYLKLRESLGALQFAEPDMEQQYRVIKEKKVASLDRKPAKRIRLYSLMSVAAALVLLLCGYQFFVFSNQAITDYGQTSEIKLADGSTVVLNNRSAVSYPNWFALRRALELDGEAFFKVSKGKAFTVETELGSVTVMGTQFNVIVQNDYFEVSCYEGKVCVAAKNHNIILTKGLSVRFYQNQMEQWEQSGIAAPGWLRGESTFRNAPLEAVMLQFENKYNRRVAYPESLKNIRFTGSFTHRNIETALRSICIPLQMQFDQTTDGKIVLSK